MNYQERLNMILIESDTAVKDVTKLIKNDKEAEKIFKTKELVDYLDYIYTKYESELELIMKKYKMDYDELAQVIIKN